jgi:DNA-binding NarL/FixJ family response regulator
VIDPASNLLTRPAPIGPKPTPVRDPETLVAYIPEHLLPIVAQLLTGATDATASQRLGMSPRTFSRRVSELLEYLGVQSRFQAGVASVRHGWVVQRKQRQPIH